MKEKICIGIGAAGGLLAAALGGWDLGLQVLLGFMAADLGTGPSRLRKTPDAWAFPCRQRGKMLSVC